VTLPRERRNALIQMRDILLRLRDQAITHRARSKCTCVNAKFRDKFILEVRYALKHYPYQSVLENLKTKYREEFGDEIEQAPTKKAIKVALPKQSKAKKK